MDRYRSLRYGATECRKARLDKPERADKQIAIARNRAELRVESTHSPPCGRGNAVERALAMHVLQSVLREVRPAARTDLGFLRSETCCNTRHARNCVAAQAQCIAHAIGTFRRRRLFGRRANGRKEAQERAAHDCSQ